MLSIVTPISVRKSIIGAISRLKSSFAAKSKHPESEVKKWPYSLEVTLFVPHVQLNTKIH